jgi:hypothetical protein
LDEVPCLARFDTFLARSSEFVIFSGWVLGLLGVVFTSLLDFYRASRSCHEVLNELISEVLLSTLGPGTNQEEAGLSPIIPKSRDLVKEKLASSAGLDPGESIQ